MGWFYKASSPENLERPVRFAIDAERPRFYPPRLSGFWATLVTPFAGRFARRIWKLDQVEIDGIEAILPQISPGDGVLITPNHSFEGDAFVLWNVARRLRRRFHFMADWRAFRGGWHLKAWLLQRLGVFSVDRDGSDRQSLRTAIDLLCGGQWLVAFPEGEIHHLNQRLKPFLDGVGYMARTAQKQLAKIKPEQRIWLLPAAIRYRLNENPRPDLEAAMTRLENRMIWTRPPRGTCLHERILYLGDMMLTLKEKEKLGRSGELGMDLPTRIAALTESLLARHEAFYLPQRPIAKTIPLRVKALRRSLLEIGWTGAPESPEAVSARDALDDVQLALQLYSYPGNYIADDDSLLAMTETIEKYTEDVYGIADPIARRRARIVFGEPIDLRKVSRADTARGELTEQLERETAELLKKAGEGMW